MVRRKRRRRRKEEVVEKKTFRSKFPTGTLQRSSIRNLI